MQFIPKKLFSVSSESSMYAKTDWSIQRDKDQLILPIFPLLHQILLLSWLFTCRSQFMCYMIYLSKFFLSVDVFERITFVGLVVILRVYEKEDKKKFE